MARSPRGKGRAVEEGAGRGEVRTEGRGPKAEPDSETPRRRQVSRAGGGEGAWAPAGRVGAGPEGLRGGGGAPRRAAGPEGLERRWPCSPTPHGLGGEGGRSAPAGRRVPGAAELAPLPVSLLQARAARGDTQAGRGDSPARGPQRGRRGIRTRSGDADSPQPDRGDVGPRRVGIRVPLRPGVRSSAKK